MTPIKVFLIGAFITALTLCVGRVLHQQHPPLQRSVRSSRRISCHSHVVHSHHRPQPERRRPMSLIDEARRHVVTADQIGTTKPMTEYHLLLAQTKATLALAEQQRIANHIAILSAENADFYTLMPSRASEIYGTPTGKLLAEVQKALGTWEPEAGEDL
jgi:hypothetical protein